MPGVILATASYDHTIRFWEPPSGLCYRNIQLQTDTQVNRLEITPTSQYLAAAGVGAIRFYEIGTNNPSAITSYEGHTGNITSILFQRDGQWMVTGGEDGSVKTWDLRASGCQREYRCGSAVNAVALHPNQCELICGLQSGSVRVWDLVSGTCSREVIPAGEVAIRDVSVCSNGRQAIACNNKGIVFVWKLGENSTSVFDAKQKLEAHKTYVLRSIISPDSKVLATLSADSTIKLWELDRAGTEGEKWKLGKTLKGHQRWVWDGAFSIDSQYLVTGSSDNSARLWDLTQGDSIRHYTGHHKAVIAVALKDN